MKPTRLGPVLLFAIAFLPAILVCTRDVDARGGRGGFGRGGTGSSAGSRVSPNLRSQLNRTENKEREEQRRRDERNARVEAARIEYAKRERQQLWEADAQRIRAEQLARLLATTTD